MRKVLYFGRPGCKSINIPLVLNGFKERIDIPLVLECFRRIGEHINIPLVLNDSAGRIGENLWFRGHSGGCLGHLNHGALGRIEVRFGRILGGGRFGRFGDFKSSALGGIEVQRSPQVDDDSGGIEH